MADNVAFSRGRTRHRDRRAGVAGLVASLAPALRRSDPSFLRVVFEEGTRRLIGAERVTLRDGGAVAGAVRPQPPHDMLTLEIPTGELARPAVLEAVGGPTRQFDAWDVQTLGLASQLAALVLEFERLRLPRLIPGCAPPAADPLVGSTDAMCALRERIQRVAATDFTVLIEGESGTGKELVARHLHQYSRRANGPFVAVNCAAIVESLLEAELFGIEERTATGVRGRRGKFEQADGGTLFLDEVSDLAPSAQAKLLRAIQDLSVERVGGQTQHPVDIRIVAATNRSLSAMVSSRLFRADLFFRLSGVELRVPPLRARPGDIDQLADHFLDRYRSVRALTLSAPARDALLAYEWPGNVRELQRVIERIVALSASDIVALDDLPPAVRGDVDEVLLPSLAANHTMRAWGSRYARMVLTKCGDNKRRACELLDISYHTLQAYLRYRDHPRRRCRRTPWPPTPMAADPGVTAES